MGDEILWKWPNFLLSRARDLDLDLGSGHTAYHRVSLIDLYIHTIFHWNRRKFLWTDRCLVDKVPQNLMIFCELALLGWTLVRFCLKHLWFILLMCRGSTPYVKKCVISFMKISSHPCDGWGVRTLWPGTPMHVNELISHGHGCGDYVLHCVPVFRVQCTGIRRPAYRDQRPLPQESIGGSRSMKLVGNISW